MPEQQTKLLISFLRQASSTAQSGKIDRANSFLEKAKFCIASCLSQHRKVLEPRS